MFKAARSLAKRTRVPAGLRPRAIVLWDGAVAAVLTAAALTPQLAGDGLVMGESSDG